MSFGITAQGFVRKSKTDIISEMETMARLPTLFGPDIDLTEFDSIGLIFQNVADQLDQVWQSIEDSYYAKYIDSANGTQLDRVCSQGGISRIPAKTSIVTITIFGDVGAIVPTGFIVQTPQGIQFQVISGGIANPTGVDFLFQSILTGSQTIVPANTITEIVTPEPGLNSITNALPSSGGGPSETDAELRQRYKDRETSGGSSVPSIRQSLLLIPNVNTAFVFENDTNVIDANGRNPHSIECVVGGTATDLEIATAIYNSKPAGIETLGTHSFNILDANGQPKTIKWSVPIEKDINVVLNVTSNSNWIPANVAVLKTRTIQVIGGIDTIGTTATEYRGLGVGKDVVTWQIIANFDGIVGMDAVTVLIAYSPSTPTSSAKLPIADTEFARSFTANITVNVT